MRFVTQNTARMTVSRVAHPECESCEFSIAQNCFSEMKVVRTGDSMNWEIDFPGKLKLDSGCISTNFGGAKSVATAVVHIAVWQTMFSVRLPNFSDETECSLRIEQLQIVCIITNFWLAIAQFWSQMAGPTVWPPRQWPPKRGDVQKLWKILSLFLPDRWDGKFCGNRSPVHLPKRPRRLAVAWELPAATVSYWKRFEIISGKQKISESSRTAFDCWVALKPIEATPSWFELKLKFGYQTDLSESPEHDKEVNYLIADKRSPIHLVRLR